MLDDALGVQWVLTRFEKVGDGWTHDRIDWLSDIHVRVGRNWTRNVGCLLTPAAEL